MDSGLAPTVRPGMTSFGILAMRCIRVLLTKETRKRSLGDHLPRPHLNGGLPAKNKEAERRQTHGVDARTQAACRTRHGVRRLAPPSACRRARLPAFHDGSRQRDFRPEGSASGQASRKAAGRSGHIDRLFAKPESISTSILQRSLSVKSDPIRYRSARLLKSRRALDAVKSENCWIF
jgi:hypothetical protein